MAAFSPWNRYGDRSVSLPTRSHPSTVEVEEELNKLKSWEASSSSSKAETICRGLLLLNELYKPIQDLLNLPLTQQALAHHQHQKWINELLEGTVRFLDVCCKTRDSILSMQGTIRELQSALRRRKVRDLSNVVRAYISSRREMKKETARSLASLKPMHSQFGASMILDLDDHLTAVVRVLMEKSSITMSIFNSLLLFLSVTVMKPRPSRWSMVFRLVQKGVLAGKDQRKNVNELVSVDIAVRKLLMQNSREEIKTQKIKSSQIRLEALDVCLEGLEKGLGSLFRHLIQTRVALLSIMSRTGGHSSTNCWIGLSGFWRSVSLQSTPSRKSRNMFELLDLFSEEEREIQTSKRASTTTIALKEDEKGRQEADHCSEANIKQMNGAASLRSRPPRSGGDPSALRCLYNECFHLPGPHAVLDSAIGKARSKAPIKAWRIWRSALNNWRMVWSACTGT